MEVDCWDGRVKPIVTHGGTFCTVEQFDEVAKAIADCAFTISDYPVIVSLEMHCCPKQQHLIAKSLAFHLQTALLTVC